MDWRKEHKLFQKAWNESKDKKFVVSINWGLGLLNEVVEVRKADAYDDEPEYYADRNERTIYEKDTIKMDDVHAIRAFDTEKEAELFLMGAQFFRDFMAQFYTK